MAHKPHLKFYLDAVTHKRTMEYRGVNYDGTPLRASQPADVFSRDAILFYDYTKHPADEGHVERYDVRLSTSREAHATAHSISLVTEQFELFEKWYRFGQVETTNFDDVPTEAEPTLAARAIFTQPDIYTAPGIRKVTDARNDVEHAYSMRNGRNTLFVKYSNVDSVEFVDGTGPEWQDRYQLHILTKNLVLYRIWCLASERIGLEYANEGLTTHKSASEYYITKQIAEGQASGTAGGADIDEVALKALIDGESPRESGDANGGQ